MCLMSQMFLFYFIYYGGALVFLGGAGAPASTAHAQVLARPVSESLTELPARVRPEPSFFPLLTNQIILFQLLK